MSDLSNLKLILREGDIPFFTDEQLNFYLEQNGGMYGLRPTSVYWSRLRTLPSL